MYIAAFTGSESGLFVLIQNIVVLSLIGLLFISIWLNRKGNKYWAIPAGLLVLGVLPFVLDSTLAYEIRVNQTDIIVDEPIITEVVIKNPTPIWVWYPGFTRISFHAVKESTPQSHWNHAVADASGSYTARGFIPPRGERVLFNRKFTHNETGVLELRLILWKAAGRVNLTKSIEVTEDPLSISEVRWNKNGENLPFLSFRLDNRCEESITAINVKIDQDILPWNFGVNRDNHLEPDSSSTHKVSTAWYDPNQKEVIGVYPQTGFHYNVLFKAKYSDGTTRTSVHEIIPDDYNLITGPDTSEKVYFDDESLMSFREHSTIAISIENSWYDGEMLDIARIHVYLNSTLVVEVNKWIPFGQRLAFSTIINDVLTTTGRYNMTVVVTSTQGNVSKTTKFIPNERYIVEKVYLLS